MISKRAAWSSIGGIVLICAAAQATVVRVMPLSDLVRTADLIVVARVAERSTRMYSESPYTCARLEIAQTLKGTAQTTTTVCERGGQQSDGRTVVIAGSPDYRVGERIVAFLANGPHGAMRTRGFAQGLYHLRLGVDGQEYAARELEGVSLMTTQGMLVEGSELTTLEPRRMTLADLVRSIRGLR